VRKREIALIFVGAPNPTDTEHILTFAGKDEVVLRHLLNKVEDLSCFTGGNTRIGRVRRVNKVCFKHRDLRGSF
jgi:hypothetical protein